MIKVARAFTDHPDDLNDLFQEILLQIWLAVPTYRGQSKPATWIYRVALNRALVWRRKEKKEREKFIPMSGISEPVSPDTEQNAGLDQLYRAIRRLKPVERSLLLLHLDGFTYQETADVLGMTESNVGVRLSRSKRQLSRYIQETSNGL